jgi:plasmid maintenance system killer protein
VNREFCKRFSAIEKSARMRLDRLNAATSLKDLAIPGHNLKKLEGDREGQYGIRINDQYRVCFEWKNGDAINWKWWTTTNKEKKTCEARSLRRFIPANTWPIS